VLTTVANVDHVTLVIDYAGVLGIWLVAVLDLFVFPWCSYIGVISHTERMQPITLRIAF
jgi:hypothetical protein